MKKSVTMSLLLTLPLFLFLSPVLFKLTTYLHPIVLVVALFCLFLMIFFIVLWIRKETIQLPYSLFKTLLFLYTIELFILLFFRPNNQSYHSINLIPFSTIGFYLSGKPNWLISCYNLTANIGLFIPYGIFLMVKKQRSVVKLIFLPLTAIVLIEIGQFLSNRGSMDIDDLILNLLGVFVGYWISPLFKRVVALYRLD